LVEAEIWQYYLTENPGDVQVLGVDTWNYPPADVFFFKTLTGTTYPLLLNGSLEPGGNVTELYGTYHNFIVIDMADTTVTYNARFLWPHINSYQRDEIRAAIDEIVNDPVAVGDGDFGNAPREIRIKTFPNPFRGRLRVELNNPSSRPEHGRIALLDVRGRRVAELFDGVLSSGPNRFEWSANLADGRLPTGVYLLRATIGDRRIQKRVIYLP
jgi:hypothetical protein